MNVPELLDIIKLGEDSKTQFKEKFTNPDALAAEIVAFANSLGGELLVGVYADEQAIENTSIRDWRSNLR